MKEYVRPTRRYNRELKELREKYERIDLVSSAVQRELARNQFLGDPAWFRRGWYLHKTYPIPPMPVFQVLYTFDVDNPEVVVLLGIRSVTDSFE